MPRREAYSRRAANDSARAPSADQGEIHGREWLDLEGRFLNCLGQTREVPVLHPQPSGAIVGINSPREGQSLLRSSNNGRQMPHQTTCPKCNGEHVRAVTIWRVAPDTDDVTNSPQPVWTCQALSCRHQWPRQADAEATRLQTKWKSEGDKPCAHPIQNLLDLSPGATGPVMGFYYCGECGKEIVRPYKRW
jgi:hypothetical protein